MKTCPRCGQTKPLSDFNTRAASPDGRTSACRPCLAAAERERRTRPNVKTQAAQRRAHPIEREKARQRTASWREQNRQRDRNNARGYYQQHTQQRRDYQQRYKADPDNAAKIAEGQSDWYQRNKEEKLQYHAQRRAAKADELREQRRRRRVEHPELVRAIDRAAKTLRRARQFECQIRPFTQAELAMKWAYWGKKCWVCGEEATTLDHVKPLSRGGAHMLCNFRPACMPCNSAKGGKWPLPTRETIMGVRHLRAR